MTTVPSVITETPTSSVNSDNHTTLTFFDNFSTPTNDVNSTTACWNNCSTTNGTGMTPNSGQDSQATIIYVFTTIIIGLGMIGIGASVNYKVLWSYIKKPKAYLLGVGMQLLIMPLLAWAFTRIFSMPPGEALGVFIQGCSPGGTTSNIVVYWVDGIVDLSVVMTGTSTLLAMGMMPLWLLIYSKGENLPSEYTVPFDRLAISLALLVVPVAIGVVINAFLPKKAPLISKVLIILASIFILIMVIVNSVLSKVPWVVTGRQAGVAAIMPLFAFGFGYLVTIIPGININRQSSRTIAVETALQNVQISSAVIQISFGTNIRLLIQMILFPLLYYVFQVGYSAIFAALFMIGRAKGFIAEDEEDKQDEKDVEQPPNTANTVNLKQASKQEKQNGETNPTFVADPQ